MAHCPCFIHTCSLCQIIEVLLYFSVDFLVHNTVFLLCDCTQKGITSNLHAGKVAAALLYTEIHYFQPVLLFICNVLKEGRQDVSCNETLDPTSIFPNAANMLWKCSNQDVKMSITKTFLSCGMEFMYSILKLAPITVWNALSLCSWSIDFARLLGNKVLILSIVWFKQTGAFLANVCCMSFNRHLYLILGKGNCFWWIAATFLSQSSIKSSTICLLGKKVFCLMFILILLFILYN